MFQGADTDEMREVQGQCQKVAQVAQTVIMFLTILCAILKAASLWTGGSSAAYAAYLEGTVIPWLKKIVMALNLFSKVLGENAQAQDEVSAGRSVDFSQITRYVPARNLPTTSTANSPIICFPSQNDSGALAPVTVDQGPRPGAVGGADTLIAKVEPSTVDPSSTYTGGSGSAGLGSGVGVGAGIGAGSSGAGAGGSYSGGVGGGLGAGDVSGSGAMAGSGSGSADGTYAGSAGSALGAGSAGTGSVGSAGDISSYQGQDVGPAPVAGGLTASGVGDGGTGAGTYAAAGAAGALGLGGAALAGRGTQGSGYTSPAGFDYNRVKGIKGNPNVTPEFLRKTERIAAKIGAKPEHLLAVMSFETGGSFSAAQKNNAGGSATGLIQFMPATAKGMGTTTAALAQMTPVQQLDYVEKYFGKGHYTTVEGLYSKVLAGRAVNDPDGALFRDLAGKAGRAYRANAPLDVNHDGVISAGEAARYVRAKIMPAR